MSLQTLHTTYCRLTCGTANLKVWEADWFAFSQAAKTLAEQVREQFSPVVGEAMPAPNVVPIKELLKKAVAGL